MSLGLEGAYGADAFQQALRQHVLDQLAQQQQAFQNDLARRAADRADAQQRIAEQEHQATLDERQLINREKIAENTAGNLRPGDLVDAKVGDAFKGTYLSPLLQADHTLPSTQVVSGAALPGADATSTAPAVTDQPAQVTGQLRFMGTPAQNQAETRRMLLGRLVSSLPEGSNERKALEYQQATGANPPAGMFDKSLSAEPLEQVNVNGKPVYVPRSQAIGATPYHVPQQTATVTIQTTDPTTGKGVTQVLTKEQALKQGTFEAKPSSVVENRLESARAVNQVGNDIITELNDPKVAATLGPVLGRYSTLQDFIGNPPPEFSKLAGEIESYSLANMGVHGMRSAEGAKQIQHLLTAKHTPESLIAAIQGLQTFSTHYMQNVGRGEMAGATVGPPEQKPKLSADELIKKYGR